MFFKKKETKTRDESITYEETKKLLQKLDTNTLINVYYNADETTYYQCCKYADFKDKSLADVINFIEEKFKPDASFYTNGHYTIIRKEDYEMHRIKLERGKIIATIGKEERRSEPAFGNVLLEYRINFNSQTPSFH